MIAWRSPPIPGARLALLAVALLHTPALADGDKEKRGELCRSRMEQRRILMTNHIAQNAPPDLISKDCIILGAGFAGTQAGMHSPNCLIIETGAPQGIQQGLGSLLQKRTDVRFVPSPGRYYFTSQPTEFMTPTEEEVARVSLQALEAARACNETSPEGSPLGYTLDVIQGSNITLEPSIQDRFVRVSVNVGSPARRLKFRVRYVIIATGAGSTPRPLAKEQYNSEEEKEMLYAEPPNKGIPLVMADVDLMGKYRGTNFPMAARNEAWILSGTNAGAASVAAFLLEHGVPPENISMIGKPQDLDSLLESFGGTPQDAYFELNQAVKKNQITFLGEKETRGRVRFAKVLLTQDRSGVEVQTTVLDSQGKPLEGPDGKPLEGPTAMGQHFVHAFNMLSDVDKLFPSDLLKQLKVRPWLSDDLVQCYEASPPKNGIATNVGQKIAKAGPGKVLGLKVFLGEKELPVAITGAATTTIPRGLWPPDGEKTYLGLITAENKLLPTVYTPAAIPYWAPKIACGAQLMGTNYAPDKMWMVIPNF